MKNKKVKYIIFSIIVTLIASVGLSLAYFTTRIINDNSTVTIKAGQLNIIFTDTTEINANDIGLDWSTTKTFTVENQSSKTFYYNIYIKDLINTLETEGYLQYKITSNNGYNMDDYKPIGKSPVASNFELVHSVSIPGGTLQEYTIEFRYINDPKVDQSGDMGKKFSGQLMIEEENNPVLTLYNRIIVDHPEVRERISGDYDTQLGGTTIDSSYDTTGVIYKESTYKESGKDVYYFAGNPQDNWVKFAGFYWRIIRTNEDGSVRLLYAGTSPDTTEGYITSTRNNGTSGTTTWYGPGDNSSAENYNNTRYVGWKYGAADSIGNNRQNTTDSGAKYFLDQWYGSKIASNSVYSSLVSTDAIYCNDRASGAYAATGYMYYAAYARLVKNSNNRAGNQPSYQCGQNAAGGYFASGSSASSSTWVSSTAAYTSSKADTADKFSVTTGSGGNGQLKYPVGLMTADEVAFAGGLYANNAPNTYYYRNSVTSGCTGSSGDPCSVTGTTIWWTMSPYYFRGSSALVFRVNGSDNPGILGFGSVHNSYAVRPVLSLKSSVLVSSGSGTASDPYIVAAG